MAEVSTEGHSAKMSGITEIKVASQAAPESGPGSANPDKVRKGQGRRRILIGLAIALFLIASGALIWTLIKDNRMNDPLPPVSSERALIVSRRIGVAFEDAQQTWSNWFRAKRLSTPRAAELVLFSGARPSPCSGTSPVGGPFYCPLDRRASFDIVVLNQLEKRMDREAGLGTALIVARVLSEHIQGELGVPAAVARRDRDTFIRMHTLQADCLTGVWAGLAKSRIGTVRPGLYSELLSKGAFITEVYVNGGQPDQPALDIFLLDDYQAREASFRNGIEARDPKACPRPA